MLKKQPFYIFYVIFSVIILELKKMNPYFLKNLTAIFLLFCLPIISFAQLTSIEKKIFDKFISPDVPFMKYTGNESTDSKNYSFELAVYCKTHLPFPKLRNNGFSQEDINNYKTEVAKWKANYGKFFPVFIEYFKYGQAGRAPEDDIKSYENAKKEWIKSNPEAFKEFEPILKKIESPYFIPSVLPDDFPEFVNTGNEQQDNNRYREKVEKWKTKHPEFKM